MKRLKTFGFVVLLAGITTLFAFRSNEQYFEISKNLEIFSSIVKEINTYYVDDVEAARLFRTGIDAMMKSLDPYTNYYSESEIEDYRFMTTGAYGGIGATISKRGEYVMIQEPYEGWAAQKAGLMAGDVLLEIDGKSLKNKNTDDVSKLLKGSPGTEVKMLVQRPGQEKPFDAKVVREEIQVKNVPYFGMLDNNTGYIKFAGFRQHAADEVRSALEELQKNNPSMSALVLDLRGNPGGLLDEAVKAVNVFVDKGQMVVSTRGKMEEWNKEYRTESAAADTRIPVAVLIDGGSASASEIVSGSLQDLDRAVLIGENSFGKGLVQTTRPLPYNTQMKITTSKYYIPSGRCIQEIDYSDKDEYGVAKKLPDSLKLAFKTKSGRVVYDGHGIKPDIEIEHIKHANVIRSLAEKRLFFDFATDYRSKHESIPAAEKFDLTDEDFNAFLSFLKDKDYEYKTGTEETLKELEETAKEEKYYASIRTDLDEIKNRLAADKREDVKKYKEDIMEILEEEIAARYYYQSGRIKTSFDDDKDIKEAVRILADSQSYDKILSLAR